MTSFELSSEQEGILNTSGDLLVLGGPGSGKTTIAILKAGKLVENRTLSAQKISFSVLPALPYQELRKR